MITSTSLLATFAVGEFQPLAAVFGIIAVIQISQFHWYARDKNDPEKGIQR